MKIVLHGSLRKQFGKAFEIQAKSAAEAIEGLSRQLPDFPRDLLLDAVGFKSQRALEAPTKKRTIDLVPVMFGGKGKFFKILLGVALIAVALVVPGAKFLLAVGATMVLGGVVSLFMKAPSNDKSNDPPASKYLGLNRNTAGAGTPIPLAWGRVKLHGHWLSLQVDSDNLVFGSFPATIV